MHLHLLKMFCTDFLDLLLRRISKPRARVAGRIRIKFQHGPQDIFTYAMLHQLPHHEILCTFTKLADWYFSITKSFFRLKKWILSEIYLLHVLLGHDEKRAGKTGAPSCGIRNQKWGCYEINFDTCTV